MPNTELFALKSTEVSPNLRSKTFALKWPEEHDKSLNPIAVNISIDPKGFYLICLNKMSKEVECFDLILIHDTRTGLQVTLPRGANTSNYIDIGFLDVPLTSRWMTITYGNSFVANRSLRVIHFYFDSPAAAREWTDQLFRLGHSLRSRNLSSLECLEKIHSRIIHGLAQTQLDDKNIPVRSLIQYLCNNNRDTQKETKILRALEHLQLPHRTTALLDPGQFCFETFFRFYMFLMDRREVEKLYRSTADKHRQELRWENLKVFIEKQDDVHGDALGLYFDEQRAKDLMMKYVQNVEQAMSHEAFLRYLMSFDNLVFDPKKLELFMDMDRPLTHYFISSSHNTYLTGSQLRGRASVEMYRQVLLTGCRCIELDVVDSERLIDEPEIKHKNTPVRTVPFIEVIVAIRDYAFKVTPYPLILSLENHCSAGAQAKMAKYLIDVFDTNLLVEPLKSHPCDESHPLPSPNDLKYKILIKNKKLDPKAPAPYSRKGNSVCLTSSGESSDVPPSPHRRAAGPTKSSSTISSNESAASQRKFSKALLPVELNALLAGDRSPQGVPIDMDHSLSDDEEASPLDDCPPTIPRLVLNSDTLPESKATKAMSDLVHYTVPVRFQGFERAEARRRSYEISSFSEDKGHYWLKEHSKHFLWYNQRQFSRLYPRGTRFESSNYFPHPFWSVGCQMVALNYQTLDVPMQLNLGLFAFNGACGYLEKPSVLRLSRDAFDPKTRTSVENVAALQISITLLSGQFLCQDREPTFVEIKMFGIEADGSKRHEGRVRSKDWNGFQAIYGDVNHVTIRFSRIILPEMASIRFSVLEDGETLIGQALLPVAHLRPGYRHIVLRNAMNLPTQASSLFVYIQRSVYVDADHQKMADQLTTPLSPHAEEDESSSSTLNIPSNYLVRIHQQPEGESQQQSQRIRPTPALIDENQWYRTHSIASSHLNDQKNLCKPLLLTDFEKKEVYQRERDGRKEKVQRISSDYQKKIQHEEERLQKSLSRQRPSSVSSKDLEQSLFDLHRKQFQHQEEAELKSVKEYYNRLEKEVTSEYHLQIEVLNAILKRERIRVNETVLSQIKSEVNALVRSGTEKDKSAKERITQTHTRFGTEIVETLEGKHRQALDVIQMNQQNTLEQLEEQRKLENERVRGNYSYLFQQIQPETNNDDDDDRQMPSGVFPRSSLLTPPVIKSFMSSVRP